MLQKYDHVRSLFLSVLELLAENGSILTVVLPLVDW